MPAMKRISKVALNKMPDSALESVLMAEVEYDDATQQAARQVLEHRQYEVMQAIEAYDD
jgi:hypothetical protein